MSGSGVSERPRLAACLLGLGLLAACGLVHRCASRRGSAAPPCPALNPGAVDHGPAGARRVRSPRSLRIDYVAAVSGPPGARALRHLPVRRRGAVAQQGGTDRARHRGRPALRRQPLSPEALLSRHARRASPAIRAAAPTPTWPRSRWPPPIGCSRSWSSLPRTAIYALLAVAFALVFGLSGRINLAFGELAAIGSAATIAGASIVLGLRRQRARARARGRPRRRRSSPARSTARSADISPSAASRRESPQPSLIATVGLSLFLMEYLRLVQSPVTVWLPPIWSEAWPLARARRFPRQPDADHARSPPASA